MDRGLRFFLFILLIIGLQIFISQPVMASDSNAPEAAEATHEGGDHAKEWHINDMIFGHINDANEYHLFEEVVFPLPCFLP